MKKLHLFKTVLLLCALVVGSSSVWADETYEIVFKTTSPDSSTDLRQSPSVDKVVEDGASYVASFSNCTKTYVGANGIKLGSSSATGTLNFTLNSSYQSNIKSIKVVSAKYGTDSGKLKLSSGSTVLKNDITPGTDYTHNFASATSVTSIKLETTTKRAYVTKIVITAESAAGVPSATLSTTSLDFGTVNVGESQDLTFTVTPADLESDLSISCNNAKYSVSPASISQATTEATTITVTASPTAYNDDMDGTITISGGGLSSNRTVTLTTTPYDPSRVITFEKMTSASASLKAGDQFLIVYETGQKALGSYGSSIFSGESITISADAIDIINESVNILTLGGEEDAWTMKTSLNDQYLSYPGSGNSLSQVSSVENDNGKWTIEIDASGVATIINKGVTNRLIQWNASNPRFACYTNTQQDVAIYRRKCEAITVTSVGLATYASDNNLDYTNIPGLEAYKATTDGSTITLTKVNEVPSGTGVLLRAKDITANTEFNVPVKPTSPAALTGNLFVRGDGSGVDSQVGGNYNYILNNVGGNIGFYRANGQNVATNRAYLQTTINSEARIAILFDDEWTTGVADVRGKTADVRADYFDLQGRRVTQPTKGLYIVNGKKVVIK